MSRQWPLPLFADGDFTVATPCGLPEFVSPIPAFTTGFIFTQKFMQYLANWTPGILNSIHPSAGQTPDYSSWCLVAEGKRRDLGSGVVEWERTYSSKPVTHDEYETFGYNFIGFLGALYTTVAGQPGFGGASIGVTGTFTNYATPFNGTTWDYGRPRTTYSVTSRVRHDYYVIGPNQPIWSSSNAYVPGNIVAYTTNSHFYTCIVAVGPTATTPDTDPTHWQDNGLYLAPDYATPALIPSIFAFKYRNTSLTALFNAFTDVLTNGLGVTVNPTVPSRTTYNTWIGNAVSNGFSGDIALDNDSAHWTGSVTQFPAEDSRISRWAGNIWLRQTRYVLAQ